MSSNTRPEGKRRSAALVVAAALLLPAAAIAPSAPDPTVLGDYILANQAASPYGLHAHAAGQWCYNAPSEVGRDFWDYVEPLTGLHAISIVWSAFRVPFVFSGYIAGGGRAMIPASIVIGYEITGYAGPVPAARPAMIVATKAGDPCELGEAIFDRSPFPINGLPSKDQIATVSTIDPAPEYRWWAVLNSTERVRVVQRIPVTYSVSEQTVPGFVIVAFGKEIR